MVDVIIPVYNQENLVIRAVDSVPVRDDVRIIVIDDGSTDNTWANLEKLLPNRHLLLVRNEENKGVAYTVNRGYDVADAKYIVLLGSDDYFITENFEKCLEELDGTDLVYFDVEVNSGDIWDVNEKSKTVLCGSYKFMRKKFIGDTRCADKKSGEDVPFYKELLEKNPTEKFTHIVVKHYNHPRERQFNGPC